MLTRRHFIATAVLIACAVNGGPNAALSDDGPPVPGPTELSDLVTATMLAVAAGNKSGNYADLHAMGGPAFQAAYGPDKLSDLFARLRASGLDLAILKDRMPLTTRPPMLDANGRLRILGYYELPGIQLVYDVIYDYEMTDHETTGYEKTGRRWRLAAISVKDRVLPPQPELLQPQ